MTKAAVGVVSFDEALGIVLEHAAELAAPATERVPLLAARIACWRRQCCGPGPAAVRPLDAGWICGAGRRTFGDGSLRVAGQVRAGEQWQGGALESGAAIEIMTGAPMPEGADAVVMVEHVERSGRRDSPCRRADDSQLEKILFRVEARLGWARSVLAVGDSD